MCSCCLVVCLSDVYPLCNTTCSYICYIHTFVVAVSMVNWYLLFSCTLLSMFELALDEHTCDLICYLLLQVSSNGMLYAPSLAPFQIPLLFHVVGTCSCDEHTLDLI